MIQITIHTDEGDAFRPQPGPEIERILMGLIREIGLIHHGDDSYSHNILDHNGDQCGTIRYVQDEEPVTTRPRPEPLTIADKIDMSLIFEFGDKYTELNSQMKAELIVDVRAIANEDLGEDDWKAAVHLLYSRIGGSGNLLDYVTSLGPSPRRGRRGRRQ